MGNPKVSIIVPIYNVEKYLDRCMNSLVNQTLKDIEIIMVDDGSPDNCPKMCDEWAKKDSRIKVVHKKNGGLGYARNSGLDVATGEYVAFVDSDDFVKTDMYETLYNKIEEYGADTIFCGLFKYWNVNKVIEIRNVDKTSVFEGPLLKDFSLDLACSSIEVKKDWKYELSVWHGLYSNELIKKYHIRFRSEREIISEDIVFHQLYIIYSKKVVYIPDALYYYCFNNTVSLTSARYDSSRSKRMINLFRCMRDLTKNRDPQGYRAQRMLLAYMRDNAKKIVDAKFSHRKTIKYLKELNAQHIWSEIHYPIHTMAFHSSVIAFLQKHSLMNSLILFLKLVKLAKRAKNKC